MLQKIPQFADWLSRHDQLLLWVAIASLAVFLATLLLIPWLLLRIPPDYFTRPRVSRLSRHPALSTLLRVSRNLIALVLLVLGLFMLVLPGQGLLTIFAALVVATFPGKHRVVGRLVASPRVCRPINWLRRRRGRPPIEVPARH